jgi:hypothetical protein
VNAEPQTMTPDAVREFLLRSYTAVDGLWFMKAEERFGFDKALEIDASVWEVMPKIQSRQLKSLLGAANDLSGLEKCLSAKMTVEGFKYGVSEDRNSLIIRISGCHWVDKMTGAGRSHLAAKIGNTICTREFSIWAAEFGCSFRFAPSPKICEGSSECVFEFNSPSLG